MSVSFRLLSRTSIHEERSVGSDDPTEERVKKRRENYKDDNRTTDTV